MRRNLLIIAAIIALSPTPAQAQEAVFAPGGNTVTLAVTGTTARVQIQSGPNSPNIRVYNAGTVAVFLACGDVTVTAALATAMPVAPGSVEVIRCGQTYVAGISTAAATVYLTPGAGI